MPGTALRFGAVSLCLCYAMSATAIIEGVVLFAHVSTMQCPILDGAICVRARSAVRSTNMWSRPRRLLRDARYSHAVWYYQGPITLLTIHEQNENPAILVSQLHRKKHTKKTRAWYNVYWDCGVFDLMLSVFFGL